MVGGVAYVLIVFAQNITLKIERPKPGEMSDIGKNITKADCINFVLFEG